MEELHHTHKETAWGWVSVLNDWRRSRTRQRLRTSPLSVTPSPMTAGVIPGSSHRPL